MSLFRSSYDFNIESAPKSRVFEMVGTVAKYYFDGMPSVQLFKR